MSRWVAHLAGLAACVWAEAGFAAHATPPLELVWRSPAECPSGRAVNAEALRLASTDGRPLPRVHAEVTVERIPDSSYVLRLTTGASGPGSFQEFRAQTCGAVAQAAAVTLALILNPGSAQQSPKPADETVESTRPSTPQRPLPIRAAAAGLVGVQFGLLPRAGPMLGGELGLQYGPASAWLGGLYGPSQRTLLEEPPNVGGELALGNAFFYGCWLVVGQNPGLNLCAGLDFSRVWGRGVGVIEERAGAISWFSALGGATAGVSVEENFFFRLGVFVAAPLSRPSAFVEDAGDVHEPGKVNAKLYASVGAVLP